jgi:hypothetical protein
VASSVAQYPNHTCLHPSANICGPVTINVDQSGAATVPAALRTR